MTNSSIRKLIDTANQEVGYLEKATNKQLDNKTANAGRNNYTKYARDLDKIGYFNGPKNGYSWCAVFVAWCLVKTFGVDNALKITGQPLRGYGAGCAECVRYYKSIDRFFTANPQIGDQIFFSNNGGKVIAHTGLVVDIKNGKVYTIEGNTSSDSGVIANGGSVNKKSYSLNYKNIYGYGRPRYELIQDTEDDEDMTQEVFNKHMAEYLKGLNAKAPTFEQDALVWGQQNGLIQGDETGNLMPKRFMTRGELMTVLKRFYEKFINKKGGVIRDNVDKT